MGYHFHAGEEIDLITEGITTLFKAGVKTSMVVKKLTWLQKGLRQKDQNDTSLIQKRRNWPDYRRDYDDSGPPLLNVSVWKKLTWLQKGLRHISVSASTQTLCAEEIDLITEGITTSLTALIMSNVSSEEIDLITEGITTAVSTYKLADIVEEIDLITEGITTLAPDLF